MTVYQLIQRLCEYPADAKITVDGDYDILSIGGADFDSDDDDMVVNITSGLTDESENLVDQDEEESED